MWKKSSHANASSSSTKLASIYFSGNAAAKVASQFRFMEDADSVNEVFRYMKAVSHGQSEDIPKPMKWLSITVISILMSVAELLGGPEYKNILHATMLELSRPADYEGRSALEYLDVLTAALDTGYETHKAIELLSVFHAGLPLHRVLADRNIENASRVGFRNGNYTILPSLLYSMRVGTQALGFRCGNEFLANVPTDDDGRSDTAVTDTWSSEFAEAPENTSRGAIVTAISKHIGQPRAQPADTPVYLNFERPYEYRPFGRRIVLAARINGEILGFSSIYDIMATLVSSLAARRPSCPGHGRHNQAFNVQATTWMADRRKRPMDDSYSHHMYIPVRGDDAWALFLAGQVSGVDGRISFGCYDCLLEQDGGADISKKNDHFPRVYIGFG